MAKYIAGNKTFLQDQQLLVQFGAEFESDAVPSRTWTPVDDAAKKAYETRFPGSYAEETFTRPPGPVESLPKKVDPKDAIVKDAK